jgi:hypothetical protein
MVKGRFAVSCGCVLTLQTERTRRHLAVERVIERVHCPTKGVPFGPTRVRRMP